MTKITFRRLCTIAFMLAVPFAGLPGNAAAEVSVNINLGPPVVVGPPSSVVMVPGSGVYFVPGYDVDIFYYGGYWWSPRGERWYRARDYSGPWRVVSRGSVPRPVYRVPHDYRHVYARERHVPYGQWKKERGGHRERMEREDHRGRDGHHGRDEHKGRDHGGRGHGGRGHD